MRHFAFSITIILLLSAGIGCRRQTERDVLSPQSVITAIIDEGKDTRTTLGNPRDGVYYPLWKEEDEVAVFYESESYLKARKYLQAQGAVAEVNSYINETVLTAYADGEVTEIFPHIGELVGTGAPIMNVAMMDQQWASFNVREDELKQFEIGREFDAYVPALDRSIRMKVSYMKDIGDFAAWKATKETGQYDLKTFEVRATPLSVTSDLRPGMSVIVEKERRK